MLAENVASLEGQADPDYEQLFIVDDVGRGVGWANCQFYLHRDEPQGDYILMLDDDDMLTNTAAITKLKEAVDNQPELIMCKFSYRHHGVLPSSGMWKIKWPKLAHVGTSCFVTRRDIWHKYIIHFCQREAGDYCFLRALFPHLKKVEWLDMIIGKAQRISKGAPEEVYA
jgi:glycosyltransferase involved in cell wall biosynthesis